MQNVIQTVVLAYLISCWWQFISWPIISRLFPSLPDRGWTISRYLGTAFVGLIIWELSNFGLKANTDYFLLLLMIFLTGLSTLLLYKQKNKFKDDSELPIFILVSEILFGFGFAGMSLVRSYSPEIHSLEKFMDFGFIKQYLLSPTLPAKDMWFANSTINYYSFGHFWMSLWIRSWGVEPAVGYNLGLALVFGFLLSSSFILITSLKPKSSLPSRVIGGLIGSLLITLGGNTHALWYLLTHKMNFSDYWYAEATRFIHNTIHEFPSYSFVVSDLHGHVLSLPLVICFMIILLYWVKHQKILIEIVMGLLVGMMMMTNTWDVAVYGLLSGIVFLFYIINKKINIKILIRSGIIIMGVALVTALPWMINFQPISNGIGLVTERSPFWQLLVLWSGGGLFSLLAVILERKNDQRTFVWSLGICALLLIMLPEFVYAKDIYPTHPRANTMFKLTYQAFIMMGTLSGVVFSNLVDKFSNNNWRKKSILLMIVLLIFGGMVLFPFKAFPAYYGNFQTQKTLNGEMWIMEEYPDKYQAMLFLKNQKSRLNMIEAVGDSYTDFNMTSVFSGVPTVVGWRVHEWLWRGGYNEVGVRDGLVRDFYEDSDLYKTQETVKKFKIGWILVGPEEVQKYQINLEKLKKIAEAAWSSETVSVLKVKSELTESR